MVVWLFGEHDCSTEDALSAKFADVIGAGDGDLVVDLSAVRFMDASTVTVLARARRRLATEQRALVVRPPSKQATCVLSLCEWLTVSDHAVLDRRHWFAFRDGADVWTSGRRVEAGLASSVVRRSPAASHQV